MGGGSVCDFGDRVKAIENKVGVLNGARSSEDGSARMKCLRFLNSAGRSASREDRMYLLSEAGRSLAYFNASQLNSEKKAKLEALRLIEELRRAL